MERVLVDVSSPELVVSWARGKVEEELYTKYIVRVFFKAGFRRDRVIFDKDFL